MDNNLPNFNKRPISPENLTTEEIYIDNGTIYVTLSLSLAPFFTEEIEKNFYKLRLNTNWSEFLNYEEPTYKITEKVIDELKSKNIDKKILNNLRLIQIMDSKKEFMEKEFREKLEKVKVGKKDIESILRAAYKESERLQDKIFVKESLFELDKNELNEIYKASYKAEIFRGTVLHELVTPIYKFKNVNHITSNEENKFNM